MLAAMAAGGPTLMQKPKVGRREPEASFSTSEPRSSTASTQEIHSKISVIHKGNRAVYRLFYCVCKEGSGNMRGGIVWYHLEDSKIASGRIAQLPLGPEGGHMSIEGGSPEEESTGTVRALVVVARNQPDLWQALAKHFSANEDVRVLFDRRQLERRQRVQTYSLDRRGADRRRPPSIENDVSYRQYVIARPQQGTLLS